MGKYLFNGVELPALPEWDKETYPYAIISGPYTVDEIEGEYYVLRCTNLHHEYENGGYVRVSSAQLYSLGCYYTTSAEIAEKIASTYVSVGVGEWGELIDVPAIQSSIKGSDVVWSNTDIYYSDDYSNEALAGTLYLPASDPVPVLPDPLPVSPYLPINGAWVKHDVYKQVGNSWVKQPQVGYETQQGAWQAIFEQQLPEPEPEPEPDPLPPIGTSLQDCTWEQISAISAAGKAAEYFSVGDTKSVYLKGTVGTLELDTTLYVYILGFDHNSEIEGKGITFGTFKTADGVDVALVDSKYNTSSTDGTKYFNMNHWGNYNYGGWAGCDLRYDVLGSTDKAPSGYGAAKTTSVVGYDPSDTCATSPVANTLMAALPSELRAVMKPMTKYTNNTGASGDTEAKVTVTTDYLPLLAELEVFGTHKYANIYEQNKQKRYDYFAAGNSRKKYEHSKTDSIASWWSRSAYYADDAMFCYFSTTGGRNIANARASLGIAPIFLV